MSEWEVQDAKAHFGELLNSTIKHGPQIVTRRGIAAEVLVPVGEWRRLQASSHPSLKALLLEAGPHFENLVRQRCGLRRRAAVQGLDPFKTPR